MIGKAIFNRAPLPKNRMAPLPLGAIKPEGWLREQLEAQATGLTGVLHDIWPDVGDQCGWLGGDGDGWERAPYYLDGLVPLAYILEDERLTKLAGRYIEWTLQSQREDGFFGPASNDDWWPRMVMLKVLEQYFTATGDKRVLKFMDRYFRYQQQVLDEKPLKDWAVARAAENMRVALWLYNLTGMNYLLTLCRKLREQSLDWTNQLHVFPHIRTMAKQRPWADLQAGMAKEGPLLGANQPYYHREYHFSHVVNVAMGLKNPGVVNLFKSGFKEVAAFKVGYMKLMRHHGVAYGMFTGDEHLSGNNPTQGTELCAVVELMHTLEVLMGIGDEFAQELPDILEKLAFNALPAAISADALTHQYDQQANQVSATVDKRNWYNNDDDASIFGLAPHFGCCTANMHQGWPKFVSSLWYATADEGLAAISYAPCNVNFVAGGERVRLRVDTAYPFEDKVRIHVSVKRPVEFSMYLRIPGWAKQAMIQLPDGELMTVRAGETACVRRKWTGTEQVVLDLPMEPQLTRWFMQSGAVELGPLLMCHRPKEDWSVIRARDVVSDYQVTTAEPWNWALFDGDSMKAVLEPDKARAFKRGEDAARVLVRAAKVPAWGMEGAVCQKPPIQPLVDRDTIQVLELTPYGNSSLRVSQFPVAPREKEAEAEPAE